MTLIMHSVQTCTLFSTLKDSILSERIVNEQYDRLYSFDKDMIVNFMNEIDRFTQNAASFEIEQFPEFNQVLKMYNDNPKQFDIQTLTFTKQM